MQAKAGAMQSLKAPDHAAPFETDVQTWSPLMEALDYLRPICVHPDRHEAHMIKVNVTLGQKLLGLLA